MKYDLVALEFAIAAARIAAAISGSPRFVYTTDDAATPERPATRFTIATRAPVRRLHYKARPDGTLSTYRPL